MKCYTHIEIVSTEVNGRELFDQLKANEIGYEELQYLSEHILVPVKSESTLAAVVVSWHVCKWNPHHDLVA